MSVGDKTAPSASPALEGSDASNEALAAMQAEVERLKAELAYSQVGRGTDMQTGGC